MYQNNYAVAHKQAIQKKKKKEEDKKKETQTPTAVGTLRFIRIVKARFLL